MKNLPLKALPGGRPLSTATWWRSVSVTPVATACIPGLCSAHEGENNHGIPQWTKPMDDNMLTTFCLGDGHQASARAMRQHHGDSPPMLR